MKLVFHIPFDIEVAIEKHKIISNKHTRKGEKYRRRKRIFKFINHKRNQVFFFLHSLIWKFAEKTTRWNYVRKILLSVVLSGDWDSRFWLKYCCYLASYRAFKSLKKPSKIPSNFQDKNLQKTAIYSPPNFPRENLKIPIKARGPPALCVKKLNSWIRIERKKWKSNFST